MGSVRFGQTYNFVGRQQGNCLFPVKGSDWFVETAAMTGALGINGAPDQFGTGVILATGISEYPASVDEGSVCGPWGRLDVEGDFVEFVAAGFELVAVAAF